jgi:hypothetical protein
LLIRMESNPFFGMFINPGLLHGSSYYFVSDLLVQCTIRVDHKRRKTGHDVSTYYSASTWCFLKFEGGSWPT